LSIILVIIFILGLIIPTSTSIFIPFYIILTIIAFLIQEYLLLKFSPLKLGDRKKISMQIMCALNLAFAFSIGFTIPFMESNSRYNFGFVMIPLLVILNFILINKYDMDSNPAPPIIMDFEKKRPVIEFEGKKFIFSNTSLIIFAIGTPISAYLIYLFFDNQANYWLHEIVVKQTVFFLNLFFNMGATANYAPVGKYFWSFGVPGRPSIFFETFCTGIQAICVFAGIIIFIPHSKDKETSKDIIWRKAKSLIISSAIFYVVNIIRMLIQIDLYHIGYPWDAIHVSISAASSFIAAIIILLLHRWIPEFIISIIYVGTLFKKFRKSKKSKELKEEIEI
jgi:exosortase/archaeosortase family protein